MAGTIVTDRIESDASYASSVNIASPLVIANTISLGSAAAITGNVNIDSGTLFVDGTNNKVGVGTQNPASTLDIRDTTAIFRMESTTGTNSVYQRLTNATGQLYLGIDNSAGNDLLTGSSAYAGVLSGPSGRSLHIGTNGIARISIDSSGRVTKPYQPVFRARKTVQQTIQNNSADIKVTYDTADTNIGSHYNTSTSRFTAPVAGWYHFNAFFMYNSFPTDWSYSFIRFVLNNSSSNSEIMYGRVTNGSNFITLAGSTYYYLSANDYIEVYTRLVGGSGNATIRDAFAEFQGMLVC